MRLLPLLLLALPALPASALAEDLALVLANGRYQTLDPLARGADAADATGGIEALGFRVISLADATAQDTHEALRDFMAEAPEADRLLVVLSGRFVTDGERTWFLTVDAPTPSLFGLRFSAISVESFLEVLGRLPSRAVLLLGVDDAASAPFDPWLREGVGELDIPQGVTVLTTNPREAARFLADELSEPRGDLARLVTRSPEVRAEGYIPAGFRFAPAAPAEPVPPPPPPVGEAEEALWRGALALDTAEAYRNYLAAFPDGRYVAEARGALAAILAEPFREQRLAEEALSLSREARRAVQRNLALLDYDPRGIDGIFGPATRRAVANWQQTNGYAQSGYVDREQLLQLQAQADARQEELAAQAEAERRAQEAADRAFWARTGAVDTVDGLVAYLDRFPEGLYAERAADRLQRLRAEAQAAEADRQDRAAWGAAERLGTERAYARYLNAFPNGRFAPEAERRLAGLREPPVVVAPAPTREERIEERQAAEEALGLNQLTLRAVEERLAALGFDPGRVDGRIDRDFRGAVRDYRESRGLPRTAYLDEETLARLMADTIGGALNAP